MVVGVSFTRHRRHWVAAAAAPPQWGEHGPESSIKAMSLIKDIKQQLTTAGVAAAGSDGRKHGRDALGSRGTLAKAADALAIEQPGVWRSAIRQRRSDRDREAQS